MAVKLRAIGSSYNSGTSSTATPSVPVPSLVQAGDHMRCPFEVSATAPTISNLNGWTLDATIAGSSGALVLLSKTATSADAAGGTACAPTFSSNMRIASPGVGVYYDDGGSSVVVDGAVVTASGTVSTAGNPINFPASGTPSTSTDMAVVYVGSIGSVSGEIGSFTGPGAPWTVQSQASTQSTSLKNAAVVTLTQPLTTATATTASSVTNTKGQAYQAGVVLLRSNTATNPTANAGPDQSKAVLSTVTLSGSASGGTSPYTYSWTHVSGPAGALTGSTTTAPTYTAPASAGTPDVWQLTVTDAASNTATDTVTVSYTNAAPTANAGPDQSLAANSAGQTVTLAGSGTDPEGSAVTYSWRQVSGPTVTLSSTTVAGPTFTAAATGGIYIFGLTVTDSGGVASAEDQVQITVASSSAYRNCAISGSWVLKPVKAAIGTWT